MHPWISPQPSGAGGNVKNIFPCLAGVEDADGDVCADGDVDGDAGPLVAGNHAVPVRI